MTLKQMKSNLTKIQNEMAILEIYYKPESVKKAMNYLKKKEKTLEDKISKF